MSSRLMGRTNPASAGFVLMCLLCVLGGFTALAQAHPYHESSLELEWNAEAQQWEASLRVLPEDLEDALQFQLGQRVDLIHSENIDQHILRYVRKRLQLVALDQQGKASANQTAQWQWQGKEVSHKAAWIFLTLTAPPPPVKMRNTLMFEVQESQNNRVFYRVQGKRIPFDFPAHHGGTVQELLPPQ